ncbi:MAG: rhodanese-like domain-containing protein [Gammaproteobacteria bacterium]|nr:MAG: rhodanese-like domain-containing protein [Gammaproteobacteria bacterium]
MKNILAIFIILQISPIAIANEVTHIGNQEFRELMQQGVAVIDVRTVSEWQKTGVIEGSHLIMFYDETGKYDLNAWLNEVTKIAKKDEALILICHSGSRSKQLAKYLTSVVGYNEVFNVKRGIAHWIKKKNSVVAPPQVH